MVKFKNSLAVLVTGLLLLAIFCPAVRAEETSKIEVVIIYEEPYHESNPDFNLVAAFYENLGHFSVEISTLASRAWEKGKLQGYNVVIYIGNRPRELSGEMLEEISSAPYVLWLEDNIEDLARVKGWQDFKFYGKCNYFVRLYAGGMSTLLDPYVPLYLAQPGAEAEILATVSNMKDTLPVMWQRDNIFYLGKLDFSFPFDLLLGDVLHQILPCHEKPGYKVLLRIEDVSPFTNPENLQKLIDVALYHDIPYAIAVTPFARNKGQEASLSQARELVKVLRKAQETSGFIIMHGCYHSNEYSPETGEGFEFWNPKDEKPMEEEPEFTRQRIEKGLKELAKAGIYPAAFEAPHYAMSSKSYAELARYFSTYVGQIQLSDETYKASLELPYKVTSYRLPGMKVWPETLGYVDPGDVMAVAKIREKARFHKILPHVETCVFYHGFLSPEGLEEVIDSIEKEGYVFASLGEERFWVKSKDIKIWGENGLLNWESDIAPIDPEARDPLYKGPGFITKGVIGLAFLVPGLVIFFGLIVWNLRRRRNRLYEEG